MFRPSFGCAQKPKAGQNTQQLIILALAKQHLVLVPIAQLLNNFIWFDLIKFTKLIQKYTLIIFEFKFIFFPLLALTHAFESLTDSHWNFKLSLKTFNFSDLHFNPIICCSKCCTSKKSESWKILTLSKQARFSNSLPKGSQMSKTTILEKEWWSSSNSRTLRLDWEFALPMLKNNIDFHRVHANLRKGMWVNVEDL